MYSKRPYLYLFLPLLCLFLSCSKSKPCSESQHYRQLDQTFLRIGELYTKGNAQQMKYLLDSIKPSLTGFSEGDSCQQHLWLRYLHSRLVYYAQFTTLTDSMIFFGKKAKDFSLRIGDGRSLVKSISNLADVYRQTGDISRSISEYDDGIRLNDSIQADSALYLPLYSGMACSFNVLHNELKTEECLRQMLSLSRYMTTVDSISYFTMKGNSLYFAHKYQESLKVFLQYDSLLQHHPDLHLDRVICDVDLADNYIHLFQHEKAKLPAAYSQLPVTALLDRSLASLEKNGITAYSPYIHTLQILHLLNLGRNADALKLARSTMAEIPQMNPDHRVARYGSLAVCLDFNHLESEAHEYEKKYYSLDDSLRNIQTIALTHEIENRYAHDAQVKEQELELERRDIHELHLYLAMAVLLIIILALALFSFIYSRKGHKRYHMAIDRIHTLRGQIFRSRLTPQFLENALAFGHSLSDEDKDNIVTLLHESLAIGDSLTSSLSEELALAHSYISVASLAKDRTITSSIHIDSNVCLTKLSSVQIPAMSLLSMVDKSLKYSTADADNKVCIFINVALEDNTFFVSVTNPGHITDLNPHNPQAMEEKQSLIETLELINNHCRNQKVTFSLRNTEDGKQVKATLKITTF